MAQWIERLTIEQRVPGSSHDHTGHQTAKLKPALCVSAPPPLLPDAGWCSGKHSVPRIGRKMEVPCKEETHPLHVKEPITFIVKSRVKTRCGGAPALTRLLYSGGEA